MYYIECFVVILFYFTFTLDVLEKRREREFLRIITETKVNMRIKLTKNERTYEHPSVLVCIIIAILFSLEHCRLYNYNSYSHEHRTQSTLLPWNTIHHQLAAILLVLPFLALLACHTNNIGNIWMNGWKDESKRVSMEELYEM